MSIEPFLAQIKDLKTIDYIQIHLNESYIYAAAHTAPHDVLESLWQGDLDTDGTPKNLIVPRASTGKDQFLEWLTAIKARGLKTQVYVNSGHLLWDLPDELADVGDRFKTWCDTDSSARWYINKYEFRQSTETYPDRQYMFCYARFILQEYSLRYGDLIDSWIFDTASFMKTNGDLQTSTDVDDQRIFQVFSSAAKSGNANAAVSFNQGVGEREGPDSPFAVPSMFDDYTFGHPFGGAGDMLEGILYDYNYRVMTWMHDYEGYAFRADNDYTNDDVISHFDPKMSTTAWNRGATPAFTNDQFVAWNAMGLINGGAITWGAPLKVPFMNRDESTINLTMHDYAVEQLTLMDNHLHIYQDNDGNVALAGTAEQSSTTNGGDASRAIDGDTNGAWSGGSVTHTDAEDNAWWEVYLDAEVTLDRIVIHNRTDACCTERLSSFIVFVWDESGTRTLRKVISTAPDSSVTIDASDLKGYRIRIKSTVAATALNLAEVQVFAK
ncbi:MAG: galactose-binding domain-containing protein [Thalassotalea sp.]